MNPFIYIYITSFFHCLPPIIWQFLSLVILGSGGFRMAGRLISRLGAGLGEADGEAWGQTNMVLLVEQFAHVHVSSSPAASGFGVSLSFQSKTNTHLWWTQAETMMEGFSEVWVHPVKPCTTSGTLQMGSLTENRDGRSLQHLWSRSMSENSGYSDVECKDTWKQRPSGRQRLHTVSPR